jgi:hypothetical protein
MKTYAIAFLLTTPAPERELERFAAELAVPARTFGRARSSPWPESRASWAKPRTTAPEGLRWRGGARAGPGRRGAQAGANPAVALPNRRPFGARTACP